MAKPSDSIVCLKIIYVILLMQDKNWVQLLNVAQFYFKTQISSSTGKSSFETVSGRPSLLPNIVDHPYVGKNSQSLLHERLEANYKHCSSLLRESLEV